MKKLAFLAILVTFSIISYGQPAYVEPVTVTMDGRLPKYFVHPQYDSVPVRQLASDIISEFKLIDFARNTEKYVETKQKRYVYKLFLMRKSDGKMFYLEFYDKNVLLSALNDDEHYIYTDGEKLFIAKKK